MSPPFDDSDEFWDVILPKAKADVTHMTYLFKRIIVTPTISWLSVIIALLLPFFYTRLTSGRRANTSRDATDNGIWRVPYWIPQYGNSVFMLFDYERLVKIRDRGHRLFLLRGAGRDVVIVSDGGIAENLITNEVSNMGSSYIKWQIASKVFGLTDNYVKYTRVQEELDEQVERFVRGPRRSILLNNVMRTLQQNIPQMITFNKAEIDMEPWERSSAVTTISSTEAEVNLMTLMRDMVCHTIIPAVFGSGILDKSASIVQDIIALDAGVPIFLTGLPIMTPWSGVAKAHLARRRLWSIMDEMQTQLDKHAKGEETDYSWGALDDVSELILERNKIWRDKGFSVKERGDLALLWAIVVTIPYLAAWHILNILSTPTLLSSIREEIAPHVNVTSPVKIGNYSSPPSLNIIGGKLLKFCPLLRSTLKETLRLTSRDWSLKTTHGDNINLAREGDRPKAYSLPRGTTIAIPHELLLHDPKTFESPEHFIPDRFVVDDAPVIFGHKAGLFGANALMEDVVLSFVAGVLMMWDIEPVINERGRKEWKVPKRGYGNGIARPEGDIRVRIQSRGFEDDVASE